MPKIQTFANVSLFFNYQNTSALHSSSEDSDSLPLMCIYTPMSITEEVLVTSLGIDKYPTLIIQSSEQMWVWCGFANI